MLGESLLLLLFLLAGAAVQRAGAPARLRDAVWVAFFWTASPVLVFVTFLTVDLDEGVGRALAAAILASWLVGLSTPGRPSELQVRASTCSRAAPVPTSSTVTSSSRSTRST